MNFEEFLEDDLILLIPSSKKNKILLKLNELDKIYNIKMLSLKEFIDNLTFTFDKKAVVYLIRKYNLKYKIAVEYLNNIKYIKESFNEKTKLLLDIKKDLEENNLIIYDKLFEEYIKNKKIVVYGYNYISEYEESFLKPFNYKIINEKQNEHNHEVFEFKNINDEVEFVVNKISNLIKNKVDINKIKIMSAPEKYYNILKRMFGFFNINVEIPNTDSVLSTEICKTFLEHLKSNNLNDSLEMLSSEFDLNNEYNLNLYNQILSVVNEYYFIEDFSEIIDILKEEFKKIKIKNIKHLNSVKLIDLNSFIEDDEYVFLMGFNQGEFPRINKDEDFFSDNEKKVLELDTSFMKNKVEKLNAIKTIKNIKNLIITYKKYENDEECFISSLINDLDFKIIKKEEKEYINSNMFNKVSLAKSLDNYVKFGEINKNLDLLYPNYKIDYKTYNNRFTGLNKTNYLNFINNKVSLSYTSMDDYYKCSFRYYLDYVLKLNPYEETFATIIGNLFHHVLSICFNDDFNLDLEYEKFIEKYDFNNKEKFYISKLKDDLVFVINTIKKQYTYINLNKSLYEEEVVIKNDLNNVSITFKGFIDKILYKEEGNKTYVIIIDYKTGNPELNINNSIYGLNLQLPVYLYLANNSNKIKNANVIGFYLQKILLDKFNIEKNITYKMQREESLKLQGYTINDEDLVSKIDDSYENSEIIKSLRKGKNGFYAYSKVLDENMMKKLLNLTEEKIDEAFNNIINANFDINPKSMKDENISCKYCIYNDICFKTKEDVINLKQYKNLEFLK